MTKNLKAKPYKDALKSLNHIYSLIAEARRWGYLNISLDKEEKKYTTHLNAAQARIEKAINMIEREIERVNFSVNDAKNVMRCFEEGQRIIDECHLKRIKQNDKKV